MKAHIVENGIVTNTIEVESLSILPNLLDASLGGTIGDLWDGISFSSPPEDIAAKEVEIRNLRNKLLTSSDWTQVIDAPVDQAAWATYRQALRDIPQQEGFPATVVWPTQPE